MYTVTCRDVSLPYLVRLVTLLYIVCDAIDLDVMHQYSACRIIDRTIINRSTDWCGRHSASINRIQLFTFIDINFPGRQLLIGVMNKAICRFSVHCMETSSKLVTFSDAVLCNIISCETNNSINGDICCMGKLRCFRTAVTTRNENRLKMVCLLSLFLKVDTASLEVRFGDSLFQIHGPITITSNLAFKRSS